MNAQMFFQSTHPFVNRDLWLITQVAAGSVDLEPVRRGELADQKPRQRRLGALRETK